MTTPEDSDPTDRRTIWVLVVVLLLFVLYDVAMYIDLVSHGSSDDLEHASERIGDLSTGPNAP